MGCPNAFVSGSPFSLFVILLPLFPTPVDAQFGSPATDDAPSDIRMEWLRPIASGSFGVGAFGGAYVYRGAFPLSNSRRLIFDLPVAYVPGFAVSENTWTTPGNPYIGLQLGAGESDGSTHVGFRLPAADFYSAALLMRTADVRRWTMFSPHTLSLESRFQNTHQVESSNLHLETDLGPGLAAQTDGVGLA